MARRPLGVVWPFSAYGLIHRLGPVLSIARDRTHDRGGRWSRDAGGKPARHKKMIDPIVSLSFSLYSNSGVYALLLGSGVSRSASIPTGWEIVQDLVHKI